MSANDVSFNDKKLQEIIKAFDKVPTVKIGILGDKNARNEGESLGNAAIGVVHEFGNENMPIRSFLRVPLAENLNKYLQAADAFSEEAIIDVIKSKSLLSYMKKIGLVAESVVQDAFNTGGFGKWEPSDMSSKKNHQTLVETQQLRNSISSEVTE